ncbi:MAG: amidase [Betaproteobacteria bacterium]|nr:amidase [Betaproteobacteria bacterium]
MSNDLHFLTIAEASRKIARRELSPVELTQAMIARAESLDAQINAFITPTFELALAQARQAEAEIAAGKHRGPLHGIPFALKDMFDTAGVRTTAHSKILANNVPERDAAVVGKLYHAGAVLIGKLASHEFAHGGPSFDLPWPPARNPWNPAHFTGGSSSGSAAAIAAGFVSGALGTDTGGSIRSPSWLTGVTGLKPTYGRVSRIGVIPFSISCDHAGPMAWTVEDCAILLQAIAGYDALDPGSHERPVPDFRKALSEDIRGMKIGVIRHFWEHDLKTNPELAAAMEAALDVLSRLGAQLEPVQLRPLQQYYDVRIVITESELFAIHQHNLIERPTDYGHHFLGRALCACLFTSADYLQAQRERRCMIAEMRPLYEHYDALVTAGAGPAPRLDEHRSIGFSGKWQNPSMGTLGSITGAPALALPCGFTQAGLPLGFQILGRPFDEETVLKIGHAYERATPWRERRPQLVAGAAPVAIDTATEAPHAPQVDAQTRATATIAARAARLKLNDELFATLCEAAPHALAMAQRIRRDFAWSDEPACVFRFP